MMRLGRDLDRVLLQRLQVAIENKTEAKLYMYEDSC